MTRERLLYEQDGFPIFQNRMYDTAEAARQCPRGEIRLVQSRSTGLIFNRAFDSELMTYDVDYENEQANSRIFLNHLNQVADIVERCIGSDELVEVGCGKAFFLELLQHRGCSISGFDPAYDGHNPAVQSHSFVSGSNVSARGIVLRHVLEHIQKPLLFLESLREANDRDGLIYIEVPCFDWILKTRAWFDVFYEHVNYFRLSDFDRMFSQIVESGHLFGGQYLYVVADLSTLRSPSNNHGIDVVMPSDFAPDFGRRKRGDSGFPPVVWGEASKGVIYALLRERAGKPVEVIIDLNSAKCGRFIPATGLRVASPAEVTGTLEDGSTICVMNSNYREEIRQMTNNRFNLIGVEGE